MKALNEEDDFNLPMTPMIDIVFQLLIFFLLATTITEEERDLQIRLPAGVEGTERGTAAGKRFVIGLRRDGSLTLGGQPIGIAELRKRLAEAGRAKDKPLVYVRGDVEAHVGKLADVLQACAAAKLSNVNLEYRLEALPP